MIAPNTLVGIGLDVPNVYPSATCCVSPLTSLNHRPPRKPTPFNVPRVQHDGLSAPCAAHSA